METAPLSPALVSVRDLAGRLGVAACNCGADVLSPWLIEAADGELRAFATGLRQNEQAVLARPAPALEQWSGRGPS